MLYIFCLSKYLNLIFFPFIDLYNDFERTILYLCVWKLVGVKSINNLPLFKCNLLISLYSPSCKLYTFTFFSLNKIIPLKNIIPVVPIIVGAIYQYSFTSSYSAINVVVSGTCFSNIPVYLTVAK